MHIGLRCESALHLVQETARRHSGDLAGSPCGKGDDAEVVVTRREPRDDVDQLECCRTAKRSTLISQRHLRHAEGDDRGVPEVLPLAQQRWPCL